MTLNLDMNQPVMPALAAFTISMTAIPAFAGTIDPALQVELEARPYALHNVLVSMVEQVDLVALESRFNAERAPLAIRHQETIESLQRIHAPTVLQHPQLAGLLAGPAPNPFTTRQPSAVAFAPTTYRHVWNARSASKPMSVARTVQSVPRRVLEGS